MNFREFYLNLLAKKEDYKEKVNYYIALDLEDENNREAFSKALQTIKTEFGVLLESVKRGLLEVKTKAVSSIDYYLVSVLSLNPGLSANDIKTAIKYQCHNYTLYKTLVGIATEKEFDITDLGECDIDIVDDVITDISSFIEDLTIETAISSGAEPQTFEELENLKDIYYI